MPSLVTPTWVPKTQGTAKRVEKLFDTAIDRGLSEHLRLNCVPAILRGSLVQRDGLGRQ